MRRQYVFSQKKLRMCYLNPDPRVIEAPKLELEHYLSQLGDVTIKDIKALDDPDFSPCDLLIVAAQSIPMKDFFKWLQSFQKRILQQGHVWTPALIFAEVPFDILQDIWPSVLKTNWYFDIMAPDHIASIPIRVANMLRIHDHLHELKRYSEEIQRLQSEVDKIENSLEKK